MVQPAGLIAIRPVRSALGPFASFGRARKAYPHIRLAAGKVDDDSPIGAVIVFQDFDVVRFFWHDSAPKEEAAWGKQPRQPVWGKDASWYSERRVTT